MKRRLSYLFTFVLLLTQLEGMALAEVRNIDNEELEKLLAQGVAVIDVRTVGEWQSTGLVEGSHPITFFDERGRYDADAWLAELNSVIETDQGVVLICASGNRSAKIANFLEQQAGFNNVYNVTQGIGHWLGEKRPVVPFHRP